MVTVVSQMPTSYVWPKKGFDSGSRYVKVSMRNCNGSIDMDLAKSSEGRQATWSAF